MDRTNLIFTTALCMAAFFSGGCSARKALVVNPNVSPEIAVYIEGSYSSLPGLYVIFFHAEAVKKWKEVSGKSQLVFRPESDFHVFRGRRLDGEFFLADKEPIWAEGQIIAESGSVEIELKFHINSGCINGRYSMTKPVAYKIIK